MKDKVVKAIEDRGNNMVHEAARRLRDSVKRFEQDCGFFCTVNAKNTAALLRALADEYDGTTKKFTIPKIYWEKAREKAQNDFMNQFDALTRFVNKGIDNIDGNCEQADGGTDNG